MSAVMKWCQPMNKWKITILWQFLKKSFLFLFFFFFADPKLVLHSEEVLRRFIKLTVLNLQFERKWKENLKHSLLWGPERVPLRWIQELEGVDVMQELPINCHSDAVGEQRQVYINRLHRKHKKDKDSWLILKSVL